MEMAEHETWENECCRCGSEVKVNLHPGKRACHLTCGPCLYPEDWGKCNSCEIVGHCTYALDYLKGLKADEVKKGCYFDQQLTGEETLYHTMNFVNGQQHIMKMTGERKYIEGLKQANSRNHCLQKQKS